MNHDHRRPVRVRRVDECDSVHEIFEHCLPAFGGAILRRVYTILDRAIGMGCPLTLSISGPVTVSGQHQAWLIPLLETGWIAYISTTDAVCYHDGHRSLNAHTKDPIYEVPIFGDDGALRDEGVIRVTDMGFDEEVLLDQDQVPDRGAVASRVPEEDDGHRTALPAGRILWRAGAAQRRCAGVCFRRAIGSAFPIFVGAPCDGSVFLNSMKLWAMKTGRA